MRARWLLVLLISTLGCRPTGGTDSTPEQVGDAPPADTATDPDAATGEDGPTRPEGAIYRSELVRATQGGSASYLLAQLAPEAYKPQGRFEGWVITRIWPGDPQLCAPGCDLRRGDIILSVNGSKLQTPEELSNILARLDELETIELTGMRDGQFFERSHPILPDPALPG
ncbi:MAG: hypothetical protein KC636_20995 [Myxococcales bacterium]|nr:hypothetical protein [Myxococcales bacterium]